MIGLIGKYVIIVRPINEAAGDVCCLVRTAWATSWIATVTL